MALMLLQLPWELWLAPLRPGGSSLALKALPLALVLPGLVRGAPQARTITSLVLLPYFVEGVVRAMSEHGRGAAIAALSTALSVLAFVCLYVADRARGKTAR